MFQILSEQFALRKVNDETRRFNHLSGDVVMQVDPEVVRVHVDFGRVDRVDYVWGHSGNEHSNYKKCMVVKAEDKRNTLSVQKLSVE